MGSEPVEELPDDLEAWVAERAAAADTTRVEVLRRLMAAHRVLDENPGRLEAGDLPGLTDGESATPPADEELADLDARIDELAGRVGALEGDLDEKITDVRERVVQVKREADAKAPADHDHPAIERRIDEGFGNYEEILESLAERVATLEDDAADRSEKLRRVANTVVDLRRRLSALEGVIEGREAVAELREAANRRGISEAACESCGKTVQVGLLEEPACPHCESSFEDVEAGGWFKSNRLTVGDPPALESGSTPSGADGRSGGAGPSRSGTDDAGSAGSQSPTGPPGSDAESAGAGTPDAAVGSGGGEEHRGAGRDTVGGPENVDNDPGNAGHDTDETDDPGDAADALDADGIAGDPGDGDGSVGSAGSETVEEWLGTDGADGGDGGR